MITPAADRDSSGGQRARVTDQVYGAIPEIALNEPEYGAPTVARGQRLRRYRQRAVEPRVGVAP